MKKEINQPYNQDVLSGNPGLAQLDVNLFGRVFSRNGYTLLVRPMCLDRHISTMHRWANLPYSGRFWQMQGDRQSLYNHYLQKVLEKECWIFFVYLEDVPIALFEVYQAVTDEVSRHHDFDKEDYGIHLMMAPYRELLGSVKSNLNGISYNVLMTILQYLFSFTVINKIIAEPDKDNRVACGLAEKMGFSFLKEILMSYKTANLYSFEKSDFQKMYCPR